PDLHPGFKEAASHLEVLLGVAQLRRGEMDNCVHDHNASRCLLPITPAGRHGLPAGSTKAIEYFTKRLLQAPDDLEAKWLLNLASMTLGRYPDGVPEAHRIPPRALESAEDPGRSTDAAAPPRPAWVRRAGGAAGDSYVGALT